MYLNSWISECTSQYCALHYVTELSLGGKAYLSTHPRYSQQRMDTAKVQLGEL